MLTKIQIKQLSDLEIAILLCSTEENTELYNEFVARFRKELEEYCHRKCQFFKYDKHVGTEICHDCLDRFRRYRSFTADKVRATTGRKGVLVFLFKIASNLFLTYSRREKKFKPELNPKNYFADILQPTESGDMTEDLLRKKDMSLQIFKGLTPREREVIVTDLEYKRTMKYLPDEVTEWLADKLGVTKATIRKIRQRAIEKMKKINDEINR